MEFELEYFKLMWFENISEDSIKASLFLSDFRKTEYYKMIIYDRDKIGIRFIGYLWIINDQVDIESILCVLNYILSLW